MVVGAGETDGLRLGAALLVGASDGISDGTRDGVFEGTVDGEFVVVIVGAGDMLGASVGARLSVGAGLLEGTTETLGDSVSSKSVLGMTSELSDKIEGAIDGTMDGASLSILSREEYRNSSLAVTGSQVRNKRHFIANIPGNQFIDKLFRFIFVTKGVKAILFLQCASVEHLTDCFGTHQAEVHRNFRREALNVQFVKLVLFRSARPLRQLYFDEKGRVGERLGTHVFMLMGIFLT